MDPDLTILGKTLGNGYAITAVLGTKPVMLSSQSTFISSTFFTERLGYVAALAVLDEMEKTRSWEVISKKGAMFKQRISTLFGKHGLEVDVTGMDALVSFNVRHADTSAAKTYITQEMLREGFLAGNLFLPKYCSLSKRPR